MIIIKRIKFEYSMLGIMKYTILRKKKTILILYTKHAICIRYCIGNVKEQGTN